MNTTQDCRNRGVEEFSPGRFACSHPALNAPYGVTLGQCDGCYFRDREPTEEERDLRREHDRRMAMPPPTDSQGRVVYAGCGKKAEPPPWYRRVWSFLRAVFLHVSVDGLEQVPQREFKRRLAVCQGCQHYWERSKVRGIGTRWECWKRWLMLLVMREEDTLRGCAACGCSGLKLRLPSQACPLKKWDVYQPRPSLWRRLFRRTPDPLHEVTKTSGG